MLDALLVGMFKVEATLWEVEDPTILNGTYANGEAVETVGVFTLLRNKIPNIKIIKITIT